VLLLGGWLLAVIAFFSLSEGKRGVYLLPATPALALLVAPWAEDLARRRGVQRVAFALSMLFTLAIVWLAAAPPRRLAEAVARGELAMPLALPAALAVAGVVCMAAFRLRRAVAGLLVLSLLAWNLVGWLGAPVLDPVRSGRRIAEELEAAQRPGEELALAHWKEQFLLYLPVPLVHFGHRRPRDEALADAAAWLAAGPGRVVLVNGDRAECVDVGHARFLGRAHRNDWYLVDRQSLSADCGDGRSRPAQVFEYRPPMAAAN
jgi:4-amino-4-deoxy-L-arabinose transferase-like glycosyltransferase